MVAVWGIGGSEARIDAAEPTGGLQAATKAGNLVPEGLPLLETVVPPSLLLFRSERGKLFLPERSAGETPSALGCLGKKHPCATGLRGIAGNLRDDLRHLRDELLLTGAL